MASPTGFRKAERRDLWSIIALYIQKDYAILFRRFASDLIYRWRWPDLERYHILTCVGDRRGNSKCLPCSYVETNPAALMRRAQVLPLHQKRDDS